MNVFNDIFEIVYLFMTGFCPRPTVVVGHGFRYHRLLRCTMLVMVRMVLTMMVMVIALVAAVVRNVEEFNAMGLGPTGSTATEVVVVQVRGGG